MFCPVLAETPVRKSFRILTYGQARPNPFRIRTYEKPGGEESYVDHGYCYQSGPEEVAILERSKEALTVAPAEAQANSALFSELANTGSPAGVFFGK